ncbi:MAG: M15 family metallopeptidase [Eubacteriales bacterium]|nr:M15 family metallopeptidase [Eubacteriales bacterium]
MKKYIFLIFMALCVGAFADNTPPPSPAPTLTPQYQNIESNLIHLVNMDNPLPAGFKPSDLVLPKVPTRKKSLEDKIYMREEAAEQLEKMFLAASVEKGYTLYAVSGYRSYGIQQINFNTKVQAVGSKEKASSSVMPPGASEHQLGLTMDIQSNNFKNLNADFAKTEEGQWLMENAYRFGFIMRYKTQWKDITRVRFEPWHYRYVGLAHAAALYWLDMPLEKYTGYMEQLPEYVLDGGCDYLLYGLVKEMEVGNYTNVNQLKAAQGNDRDIAMKAATQAYLPKQISYEQALWRCYPTPMPTMAPRVDNDTDISLFSNMN